jgi:hypothetical protein
MAIIDLDIKIKQALQTWREKNYKGASPEKIMWLHNMVEGEGLLATF